MVIFVKNGYESMEDMRRMQQEAVMRVHEMQKRAKISLEVGHPFDPAANINNSEAPKKDPPNKIPPFPMPPQKPCFPSNNFSKNNILEMLLNDSEKSLILILILLLVEETDDMGLILALMYLMM